jgi:hypothetical protein
MAADGRNDHCGADQQGARAREHSETLHGRQDTKMGTPISKI